MNKTITLSGFFLLLAITSFSQTVRQTIDKAAKNNTTKENAAKADVQLIDKKHIFDSSLLKIPQPVTNSIKKKKEKRCARYKKN